MVWAIAAGFLAGLVLGYLGAGGTVVGIPFLLYLAHMPPHLALGTNALGVAAIAGCLLTWRIRSGEARIREGLAFAVPGLAGIFAGARIGLLFPGQRLVFLLGFMLFAVSGWMYYLSTRMPGAPVSRPAMPPEPRPLRRRLRIMVPAAFGVGCASGFFAVGGGFMIVPALVLTGGLDLIEAASAGLLPIAAFAGWVGGQYAVAGDVRLPLAAVMLFAGIAGGAAGIQVGRRLSKRTTQRLFAGFLFFLGLYMIFK